MSRNKTIEYYHKVSGLPYSVCRARLKANHWDLFDAMGYRTIIDRLPVVYAELQNALAGAMDCMGNLCKSLSDSFYGVADNMRRQANEQLDK